MRCFGEIVAETARVVDLRHQHDFEEAGPVEQEVARVQLRKPSLDRLQCAREPVAVPHVHAVLILPVFALEILEHRQVERRVQLGRDGIGQFAREVALFDIGGQQRIFRVGLVQPFDDRHRLHAVLAVDFQHRDGGKRVATGEGFAFLLALDQIDRAILVFEALQLQREPQAVARGAAEIAVEFHLILSCAGPFASRP